MSYEWDRYAILAEISRRGESLSSLERLYGLPFNSLAVALRKSYPKSEKYISRFLGIPASVLFAYRNDPKYKRCISQRKHPSIKTKVNTSQKCTSYSDIGKMA